MEILSGKKPHTSHHRGQLTAYLRFLGKDLYSTYGPSADTGGLSHNKADVIYRYSSVDELIGEEERGGSKLSLPDPGAKKPTERPDHA